MAALSITALLNACTKPVLEVALDSTLTILETDWDYSYDQMREKWIIIGDIKGNTPRLHIENREYFLAITPNRTPFAALRPIKAQLLATPFLSWTWRIPQDTQPISTLRLAIGFMDEDKKNDAWNLSGFWGPSLPPFSRSLIIEWGRSAQQRGSLWVSKKDHEGRSRARYVARGGPESQGRWWHETIDLSLLHSKAWPKLDMRDTQIVFAGFILNKHNSTLASHLKEISLSR
tara:strand:+ start:35 stop:730 length:696 start_codon:yes stop_codon:yes gene_type:complete